MKIAKIALGVAALVLALALIAVAVIAARFDPNSYKAELAALVKEKTGRTLSIDGPIALSYFPKLGVAAQKIRMSERGGSGQFASIGEARLSLALWPLLHREVVVDRITLSGVAAQVVRRKDGKTSIDDLTGGGQEKKQDEKKVEKNDENAPIALDVAGMDIGIDSLRWRDERDGGEWHISAIRLQTGRIADEAPGKLSLKARIEGANPPVKADIELASGYRFNFSRQKALLSDLSLKIAGDLPSMKGAKLALDGQMDADWGQETAGGILTAKFDESTLKAKFDVKGFSPAMISFDADIDKLNVDRYLSPGSSGEKPDKAGPSAKSAAKEGAKPATAEQPLDLEGLKALNLKGQLRVGQLTAVKVKMEKVQLALRAAGGRVDLNPMDASLYGGTLAGTASINAHTYQFAAKQRLTGINIGPLLRDAADKDLLEGRGTLGLDVQTAGHTVSALKKALGGSASLVLADGALKGINLAESLRKAKAALGSKSAQEQGASQNGKSGDKTDFSELSASFAIAKGVAHNEDLSMKAPFLRLGGAGDLDIGENRMNYLAKAAVVNTSAGQGGKELESLAGLTVPVRISGPFESLSYGIEIGSLVSDTVKQKLQETVKDKVQSTLKGLFGR